MKRHINTIDFFKGFLIVLVIIGHIIPGAISEKLSRYFIYSFHMPLFIGISGFLYNYNSYIDNPSKYLKKFFKRIILPYIFANIVYSSYVNIEYIINSEMRIFFIEFIKRFSYAYYHLWYIQGYCAYIIIYYIMKYKLKLNNKKIFISALILSLVFYYFNFIVGVEKIYIKVFFNNLRLYNFVFFVLGSFIREYLERTKKDFQKDESILGLVLKYSTNIIYLLIIGILFICNGIVTFYLNNEMLTFILFYISNIFIILTTLFITIKHQNIDLKFINFIGIHSYSFYLWHVIIKLVVIDLDIKYYYTTITVGIVLLALSIKIFSKNKN